MRQDDVDHGLPSVIVLRVTLMSPSSPVCGWAGLPQPLSSKACAADTRAVSDVLFLAMPASVCMPNSVWARAKERSFGVSAGFEMLAASSLGSDRLARPTHLSRAGQLCSDAGHASTNGVDQIARILDVDYATLRLTPRRPVTEHNIVLCLKAGLAGEDGPWGLNGELGNARFSRLAQSRSITDRPTTA